MTEQEIQQLAAQLRQPHGEFAKTLGERMNLGNRNMNLRTIAELDVKPNQLVLEIGMGNGYFVREIIGKDSSVKYLGCDFSEEMVAEASLKNQKWIDAGQVQFEVASAHQLPLVDASVDTIFTVNTIYFWDNPAEVFEELRRVLKPEGRLIITIRPKSSMDAFPVTKYGFTTFSKEALEEIMIAHGFVVYKAEAYAEGERDFFGEQRKDEFVIVSAGLV